MGGDCRSTDEGGSSMSLSCTSTAARPIARLRVGDGGRLGEGVNGGLGVLGESARGEGGGGTASTTVLL